MIEERLKVLRVMSEVTGRLDLSEFSQMVGLSPNQTVEQMQELLKANFLRKVGGGYGITEKGRAILKSFTPVPMGREFHFYMTIGHPTNYVAQSLGDFYEKVRQIASDSLEFHLYRGDFENWVRSVFGETAFAAKLESMKISRLTGEDLRKELLKAAEVSFGFDKLQ